MGYRTSIARRYFSELSSARYFPACLLLAAARLCVSPSNQIPTLARWLLPKKLSLGFRRFSPRALALNPTDLTHLQVLEEFLMGGSYDLDRVPFTPSAVIDCGAHIGLFTNLCLTKYPSATLIAFEPQPRNARFSRNQSDAPNFSFHQAAVGIDDGTAHFDSDAMSGWGALANDAKPTSSQSVRVLSLPTILQTLPEGPLLLKMDIEGGERDLVPAILPLLPPSCAVFLETHSDEIWESARPLFESAGFTTTLINHRGRCRDLFFLRTAVA